MRPSSRRPGSRPTSLPVIRHAGRAARRATGGERVRDHAFEAARARAPPWPTAPGKRDGCADASRMLEAMRGDRDDAMLVVLDDDAVAVDQAVQHAHQLLHVAMCRPTVGSSST